MKLHKNDLFSFFNINIFIYNTLIIIIKYIK